MSTAGKKDPRGLEKVGTKAAGQGSTEQKGLEELKRLAEQKKKTKMELERVLANPSAHSKAKIEAAKRAFKVLFGDIPKFLKVKSGRDTYDNESKRNPQRTKGGASENSSGGVIRRRGGGIAKRGFGIAK